MGLGFSHTFGLTFESRFSERFPFRVALFHCTILMINELCADSEKSEHKGFVILLKGIYGHQLLELLLSGIGNQPAVGTEQEFFFLRADGYYFHGE